MINLKIQNQGSLYVGISVPGGDAADTVPIRPGDSANIIIDDEDVTGVNVDELTAEELQAVWDAKYPKPEAETPPETEEAPAPAPAPAPADPPAEDPPAEEPTP